MRSVILCATALCCLTSVQTHAGPIDYSFVGAAYSHGDTSGAAGNGFQVDAGYGLTDALFLAADYAHSDFDGTTSGPAFSSRTYQLGPGAHLAILTSPIPLDFVASASYADGEVSSPTAGGSRSGYDLRVGLRAMILPDVEFYGYEDRDTAGLKSHSLASRAEYIMSGGIINHLSERWALRLDYSQGSVDSARGWQLGLRYSF